MKVKEKIKKHKKEKMNISKNYIFKSFANYYIRILMN